MHLSYRLRESWPSQTPPAARASAQSAANASMGLGMVAGSALGGNLIEAMLPDHDVYVTDWRDCRMIPVTEDRFNLNDYIDYLIDFLHVLGPNTHMIAVCQPSVPALAAVSSAASRPHKPAAASTQTDTTAQCR